LDLPLESDVFVMFHNPQRRITGNPYVEADIIEI